MDRIDEQPNCLRFNGAPAQANTLWKYIALYYAIACGISWALWTPAVLGQDGLKWLHIAPSFPIVASIGTIGPFAACFIANRLQTGNWQAIRLFPRQGLRLLWLLFGPLLVLFCFFVVFSALLSNCPPNRWHWHVEALAGLLIPMFNYNLFGGPLFEEFGWRGFLQSRLQRAMPPWIAAIYVGIMWAAWHLPLFLVKGWSSASLLSFFLILMGLSLVIGFALNASGGSVIVAILMHSAFNSSPRFLGEYLSGMPTRESPPVDFLIAGSFLLVGTVLALASRGRLGVKRGASDSQVPQVRIFGPGIPPG